MSLDNNKKHQLNKLIDYRDEISNAIFQIDRILKDYFPEEYDVAYQHWIPQIITAINKHPKWLSRGQFDMQQTIEKLLDKSKDSDSKGVSKYI